MLPDISKTLRSFGYAFKGIASLFTTENNAKIHLITAVVAVSLAAWLGFNAVEWSILVIQIAVVLAAEAFNTALEKLCDKISPEKNPVIGTVKDLAAGAVLITAVASVITGLLLFLPKIIEQVG